MFPKNHKRLLKPIALVAKHDQKLNSLAKNLQNSLTKVDNTKDLKSS